MPAQVLLHLDFSTLAAQNRRPMRISYDWLKSYFPQAPILSETVDLLTNTGLEVEGTEAFESVPGGLEGLVVGEVLEVWKHPGADRLNLTRVNPGNGEELQIVCGAPNVAAGQKVIVALEGATLHPLEGDPFTIRKGKIRGELSQGMLCAEDEIGLGKGHDGILVLDPAAVPGTPAGDYFKVFRDTAIEIGLTPNRTDAMSHYGVARDLRAATYLREGGSGVTEAPLQLPEPKDFPSAESMTEFPVVVEAPEACIRYAGVLIEGVQVKASPEWLQNRLKAIGLSPINVIVDITNFVMHEIGQPLHAFDADQIAGNEVRVRFAKEGERFTTLDKLERTLDPADLMICDTEKAMCIAGVFGGANSGITDSSTRVFLESAVFDPVSVRKTARRHQLNTDASYRFERGVDPNTCLYALRRAASLIIAEAGGQIASAFSDHYPKPLEPAEIEVNLAKLHSLIGVEIKRERLLAILEALDFELVEDKKEDLRLRAPLYRRDVTRMADVAEEVLRIYGYNSVAVPSRLHSTLSPAPKPNPESLFQRISDLLVGRGFNEIMNNSLTRIAYQEYSTDPSLDSAEAVALLNPLSSDLGQMRQSMLFQGLETIARNVNHKQSDLRLFEFGYTYHRNGEGVTERPHLAVFVTGSSAPENWNHAAAQSSFSDLHGAVAAVFSAIGCDDKLAYEGIDSDLFSDAIAWKRKKDCLAVGGVVSDALLKRFGIKQKVYYADLDWSALLSFRGKHQVSYQDLPKYPAVRRDLSLLVDTSLRFSDLQSSARQAEHRLLKQVGLFDVYEGKNLPAGKKSYALSFILQDAQSTLTDKKIDAAMQRILQTFEKEFGAELRQ